LTSDILKGKIVNNIYKLMINLDKTIKNLRGEEYDKSFPTKKDTDNLPKKEQGKDAEGNPIMIPDHEQMPKETVGNVLINCLSFYQSKDKKEGFLTNIAAQAILEGGEVELKDKVKDFLIGVLEESIHTSTTNAKGETVEKGVYKGWVISQVLESMGIIEE